MAVLRLALCVFLLFGASCGFKFADRGWRDKPHEGRYTKGIGDYDLLVPVRVDPEGSFVSHSLPSFFQQDVRRRKREARADSERVHYGINLDGQDHVVELWPNHGLISPGFVVETRQSGSASDLNKLKIRSVNDSQCHYTGRIKGQPESRVALSTCDGIVGHIRTKRDVYLIEPVEGHEPEVNGQHLHLVYKRSASHDRKGKCGTRNDWETAWANRLKNEYNQKKDNARKRSVSDDTRMGFNRKRSAEDQTKFIEVMLVADKKFLEVRKDIDYEQYLLTTVNMASDILHDETVGQTMDLVLVRLMYLEKEDEEVDLTINIDADATLTSFCKWSTRMNPVLTHPNHHDISVLVTKHDICLGPDGCGTSGLADIAGACARNQSCAICEDKGLVVGTISAHEIVHLLGADHDSEDENAPPGECPGIVEGYNIHVMSPYSQVSPASWSTCSKKFIAEFFENDLGKCFLDEPQEHNFKFPEMLPGVLYDREWQCIDNFGPMEPCDHGPDKNCKYLTCRTAGAQECTFIGPPADGTSCGDNKWCFGGKCVVVGVRPNAVNGQWGEWLSWSECSRTCGGGVSVSERQCDNPRPANHGRYCLGKRRRYKICNTEPCDDNSSFRAEQCEAYNTDDIKWTPFNDETPESVCALVCSNNKHEYRTLKPRVKDGTPCKIGSRDKCIAGKCRNVGCDWVLDSEAVEDVCGVCDGDASTCDFVDEVNSESGEDYQEITTIPAGARHVSVEEVTASRNLLALSAADRKTFFLNGDYTVEEDGVKRIPGSIVLYNNVDPQRETLYIEGPTKEDLILYILNNKDPNPGIHYKYSIPSTSAYDPKFVWDLVDWGPCSAFCGGGTQLSQPSCFEEKRGKVSKMHCKDIPKPTANTRSCNTQSCKVRWRVGEWGRCSGCIGRPGHKYRVVDCVKQSPFEDSEDMIEPSECEGQKPSNKELCSSNKPCAVNYRKRHTSLQRDASESGDENGILIIDKPNPDRFKVVEVPKNQGVNNLNLSDEALEALGDQVASNMDATKTGEEAHKRLKEGKEQIEVEDGEEDDILNLY
ncbi:A disintegrin and metalloproteinase with thrombospondin motifs 7 [Zootermopsis nevadensis]|uniref:A disintegrin and metalloproteinase with thrombospondin motifs 7 n=1 Tax=Zootermopsis nevadensis TaxID=136037 RepID=A0A067QQ35_ZOONE|nr:A disintegrin and metalloproteinase with thrombospondin motifs 7 [Zootermopsis nevadensis]